MKSKIFLTSVVCIVLLVVVLTSNVIASDQSFKGTKLIILSAADGLPGFRIISPSIPSFEEETGIDVEFIELSQSDLRTKLNIMFTAKSPDVDILWLGAPTTAEYANAGFLEDITNKLSKEEWDRFVPSSLVSCTYQGRHYGIPRFYSIRSFYYNKKIFREAGLDPDKPPETWDEFVSCAKKCTDPATGTWGILTQLGSNKNIVMHFQEYLVRTGGELADKNHNILFNNEKGVEALKKMIEVQELGVVDPAVFGIGEGGTARSRWIQGNDAMFIGWSAAYRVSNQPPSKIIGEVGVGIIPSISTSGALIGPEAYGISKFSNNKDAAFEFLKYIARPEIQKAMALRSGWYPTLTTVFQDPELASANPTFKVAEKQSNYPIMKFAAPYLAELNDILGIEILSALNGVKTAEQALNDAAEAVKPIIDAYIVK